MRSFTFLLVLLLGCGPQVDHYHRALAIEREILRRTPDAGYGDPRYVQVMQELDLVGFRSEHRGPAQALYARIRDGRRVALEKEHPGAGHLPARLQQGEGPKPQRSARLQASPQTSTPARRTGTVPARSSPGPALTDAQKARLAITLYSTTWCGYCKKARGWFEQMGYPYVEKDIERDPEAATEYAGKSGGYGGVPLIDVNGTVIRGFDRPTIERAITKAAGS
jgi:glutaredoxin